MAVEPEERSVKPVIVRTDTGMEIDVKNSQMPKIRSPRIVKREPGSKATQQSPEPKKQDSWIPQNWTAIERQTGDQGFKDG
jgi:hypothetical protein